MTVRFTSFLLVNNIVYFLKAETCAYALVRISERPYILMEARTTSFIFTTSRTVANT